MKKIIYLTSLSLFILLLTTYPQSNQFDYKDNPNKVEQFKVIKNKHIMTLPQNKVVDFHKNNLSRKTFKPATETNLIAEDFEGIFPFTNNWIVFDQDLGQGEDYWDVLSCNKNTGASSLWNSGFGDKYDCTNYDNSMQSWLYNGPFDLRGLPQVYLEFDYYLDVEPDFDYLFIGFSTDGMNFSGYQLSGNSGGWITEVYDLSNFGGTNYLGTAEVYLAFVFVSDQTVNEYEGAFLDNIRFYADDEPPPQTQIEVLEVTYTPNPVEETGLLTNGITIRNNGSESVADILLEIYLSQDPVITQDDCLIGSWTGSLAEGETGSGADYGIDLEFINCIDPGDYYYGIFTPSQSSYYTAPTLLRILPVVREPDISVNKNVFNIYEEGSQSNTTPERKFSNINYDKREYLKGRAIVKFKNEVKSLNIFQNNNLDNIKNAEIKDIFDRYKVKKLNVLDKSGLSDRSLTLLEFDKNSDVITFIDELISRNIITDGFPDYIYKLDGIPNDPGYSNQWYLNKINAPAAWDIQEGSSEIKIGIIDTGVDWDHPDLNGAIYINSGEIPGNNIDDDNNGYIDDIRGWDWVDGISDIMAGEDGNAEDNNPMDFNGHGTNCAGIAGAVTNNGIGAAGISNGCKIVPLRAGWTAADGNGYLASSFIIQAINYAVDNNINIISMSFSGGAEYLNQVNNAYLSGIIAVHAAGNGNISSPSAIDGIESTLSVAATDNNDQRASFSNYGSWIDVSAPGVSIYNTYYNNSYAYLSGTSMATPLVAGLAGLILSKDPTLTPSEVMNIIKTSADNIDAFNPSYENLLGTGRINAENALNVILFPDYFILSNNGNADLNVNSITTTKNWLSAGGLETIPFNLEPGKSKIVNLSVDWAFIEENDFAELNIYSDDPDENLITVNVNVFPVITSPEICLSDSLFFVVGTGDSLSLNVMNCGNSSEIDFTVSTNNDWVRIIEEDLLTPGSVKVIVDSNCSRTTRTGEIFINSSAGNISALIEQDFMICEIVDIDLSNDTINRTSINKFYEMAIMTSDLTDLMIDSLGFTLNFDNEIMEFTGIDTNSTIIGRNNFETSSEKLAEGQIRISANGNRELSGAGELIKLNFEMDIKEGLSSFSFSDFHFNEGFPRVNLSDGSVYIKVGKCGDTDEDSVVTSYDAALMLSHVVEIDTLAAIPFLNSDVDRNNEVSAFDAFLVLITTIGNSPEIPTCFDDEIIVKNNFYYNIVEEKIYYNISKSGKDNFILNFSWENELLVSSISFNIYSDVPLNIKFQGDYFAAVNKINDNKYKVAAINPDYIDLNNFKLDLGSDYCGEISLNIDHLKLNNKEVELSGRTNEKNIAIKYDLVGAYPNPFNPSTTIAFELPEKDHVNISVYDILGRKINTLINDFFESGRYEIIWNSTDQTSNYAASGNYIVMMRSGNFSKSIKVTLIK